MKRVSAILLLVFSVGFAWGQEVRFSAEVSIDSLLLGNTTKVTFTLENSSGSNFLPPDFLGFQVVGGPSQSSSFRMINGEVSQSLSYSYFLQPEAIGNFYISPASIETEDGILETKPLEVIVVPNPDGIQQQDKLKPGKRPFLDSIPKEEPKIIKPRKKRRIYRI